MMESKSNEAEWAAPAIQIMREGDLLPYQCPLPGNLASKPPAIGWPMAWDGATPPPTMRALATAVGMPPSKYML